MYTLACGAVAGCHCWAPLLGAIVGDRGGGCTRWRIGCGDVAGCHCWAAIAGCHCWGWGGWVYTLADWTWCRCWAAIAGCHCALPLLAAITMVACGQVPW